MGSYKALLPIYETLAIYHLAEQFSRIKPHRLFLTLPVALLLDTELRENLSVFQSDIRTNRYPECGYGGSIKTVVEEGQKDLDGIIISPVDSPLPSSALLFAIINLATHLDDEPTIIVPYYQTKPGHPVYLSKHFFPNLLNGCEMGGMKAIIDANKKSAHAIFWPDARILLNLNSPRDLASLALNRVQH